jgi:hypothetical protein
MTHNPQFKLKTRMNKARKRKDNQKTKEIKIDHTKERTKSKQTENKDMSNFGADAEIFELK